MILGVRGYWPLANTPALPAFARCAYGQNEKMIAMWEFDCHKGAFNMGDSLGWR